MDPNTTLEAIRRYVDMIQIMSDNYDPDDSTCQDILADLAGELASAAGNLDTWITNGGHLPTAWDER